MTTLTPPPRRTGSTGGGSTPPKGRAPLTPAVAVRIAALGMVAVVLIGILLTRLWFLQVIGGQAYAQRAEENRVRTIKEPAPRGLVTDRTGRHVFAQNRPGWNVVARPAELQGARRRAVLAKLAPVLDVPLPRMTAAMAKADRDAPLEGVVLAEDVDQDLQIALAERARDFPGVTLERTYVRTYPDDTLAAHVLGYTGPIFAEDYARYREQGYVGNERVGVTGVEAKYESYLRGVKGDRRVEVTATGEPTGRGTISSTPPTPGDTLRLTIDYPTQRALEQQLRFRVTDSPTATGAAGVALDPRTGEVLAMASFPTYSPDAYARNRTRLTARYNRDERRPLFPRAIQGSYPPGSTFKAVTMSSALQLGLLRPDEGIGSPAELELYGTVFPNFRRQYHGTLSPPRAMEVSSDTFFYTLGSRFYEKRIKEGPEFQQQWAQRFGFGRPTGIDLPGESGGRVPSEDWKEEYFASDRDNNFWKPGDDINMTVGQGYLEVTPLQMAVAYAAIANGGTIPTPMIAREVVGPANQVKRRLSAATPSRTIPLSPTTLRTVREGLDLASNGPNGTATAVFSNVRATGGVEVAGKTGTAEPGVRGEEDHSWFVGYAPYRDPRIVVAVVVEHGGAAAVCRTMAAYLKYDPELCGIPVAEDSN
jgi:penicillin-binding protein 2